MDAAFRFDVPTRTVPGPRRAVGRLPERARGVRAVALAAVPELSEPAMPSRRLEASALAAVPGTAALEGRYCEAARCVDAARRHIAALNGALDRGEGARAEREAPAALQFLESAVEAADVARDRLVAALRASGEPALQAGERDYRLPPRVEAMAQTLRRFGLAIGERNRGRALFAQATVGVGPRTLLAMLGHLEHRHASVDVEGAANIDHVAAVGDYAARLEVKRTGRRLRGQDVDAVYLLSFLTDARGKRPCVTQIGDMATVPWRTLDGAPIDGCTVADAYTHGLVTQLRRDWAAAEWCSDGAPPLTASLDADLARFFRRHLTVPSLTSSQRPAFEADLAMVLARHLEGPQRGRAATLVKGGYSFNGGFNGGAAMHGLVSFEPIHTAVKRAGGTLADARRVYAEVLAHHFCGYVARLLGELDVQPDFRRLVARGELFPSHARALDQFCLAAVQAAQALPPRGPAAEVGHDDGRLERLLVASEGLRAAAATLAVALPRGHAQWIADDVGGQFTGLGWRKWVNIARQAEVAPRTIGEHRLAVFAGPCLAYWFENIARGSGAAFERETERLRSFFGIVVDWERLHLCLDSEHAAALEDLAACSDGAYVVEQASGRFTVSRPHVRIARSGEREQRMYAELLAASPAVVARFLAAPAGRTYRGRRAVSSQMTSALAAWFDALPATVENLELLCSTAAPLEDASIGHARLAALAAGR